MNLREALVTAIEFVREHGHHDARLQQAVKVLARKAERMREKAEARNATIEIDANAPTVLPRSMVITDYRGLYCRVCNRKKTECTAFCFECFYTLKPATRKALRLSFGEGFEQAYEIALAELDKQPVIFLEARPA